MMNLFLSILVSFCAQVAHAQEKSTSITLKQAKVFASRNNYKIASFMKKKEAAKARRKKLSSAFMPKIGVIGGVESESEETGNELSTVGYVYGNYNLFNGFRDSYDSKLADVELDKIMIELDKKKFLVGLEVEEYFHTFIFYKDIIALKFEAVKLNNEHQRLVAKKKAAGSASQSDVMEFELKDALLKSELFSSKQKLEEARINLKRLLGQEIGSKIEPIGKIQHQHLNGDLMKYLKSMNQNSSSILLAAKNQVAASFNSKKARAGWMPSIDFEARAGYLPSDERVDRCTVSGSKSSYLCESEEPGMTVTLTATFELFSGFSTTYNRSEVLAEYAESKAELRNEILTSISKIETSFRRLKTIEARVDLEEDNVEKGRMYYDAIKKEYKRGYKNAADLSVAADGLFEARDRRKQFKFDFLTERIELERQLGIAVDVEVINEKK